MDKGFNKTILISGGIGAGIGIATPILAERLVPQFWNADPLISGQPWSQKKILLPLGIGTGLTIGGVLAFQKNESLGALLGVAGFVMAVKSAFDLIVLLMTPGAGLRMQRNFQRPYIPPRPMVTNNSGGEIGRTTSAYTPRSNKTSSETATKIKNYTIWA